MSDKCPCESGHPENCPDVGLELQVNPNDPTVAHPERSIKVKLTVVKPGIFIPPPEHLLVDVSKIQIENIFSYARIVLPPDPVYCRSLIEVVEGVCPSKYPALRSKSLWLSPAFHWELLKDDVNDYLLLVPSKKE